MNFRTSNFLIRCRNLSNHARLPSNFCTQVTFDLRTYSHFWNQIPTPISKGSLPVKLLKNFQISNFRQTTPKWPTDLQIHFRMRSQYQNHHTELFSDLEFKTDIDNIEIHFNPILWNYSKMLTSTIGAETLPGHPKPYPNIRPSQKSSYEPAGTFEVIYSKIQFSQFFQLKAFKMRIFFSIQLQTPEIQSRPRVQVIIPEVKLLMASNCRTTR